MLKKESDCNKKVGSNGNNRHLKQIEKPRVFISHRNSDRAQAEMLRLQKRNGKIEFVDYSIKEPYDKKWIQSARYRIKTSDAAVCFVGERTAKSKGMFIESCLCNLYRTPKIIVCKNKNCTIPKYLMTGQYDISNWNVRQISDSINSFERKKRYRKQ